MRPAQRIAALPPYPFATLERRLRELQAQGRDLIRMDIGSPDLPPPDFICDALDASVRDPLTGVHNRRHFLECLRAEFDRSARFQHPLSLLMIDVDNFKDYNAANGPGKGDAVLAELAAAVKGRIRSIDVLARHGGDEFAVILPETGLKGAISIAEKIRAGVEATSFRGEELMPKSKLTVSIGIAAFPDAAVMADHLSRKAARALEKAKRIGNMVMAWTG